MPSDLDLRIDAFEKWLKDYASGLAPISSMPSVSGFGGVNEPSIAELYGQNTTARVRALGIIFNKVLKDGQATKDD